MLLSTPVREVENRAKQPVRWAINHGLPKLMLGRAAKNGELQGLVVSEAFGGDPERLFELLEDVRESGAFHKGPLSFITVDHAAVREILSSNDFRSGLPTGGNASGGEGLVVKLAKWSETQVIGPVNPPSLLVTEPPDHTRYRKLVSRVFTVKAVAQLRLRAEQIAAQLLDELAEAARAGGADEVDIVEAYCQMLPVTLICEILGVPASERSKVLEFGNAAAPSLDLGISWRRFRQVEAALADFDAWLGEHLVNLRRNPGEDLLSQMVTHGGLTEVELKSTAGLVLAAGFETTVNLLSNGIALLCEHPEQLQALQREPDWWGNAADEVLRFDPPVLLTGRICAADTEILGQRMKTGTLVTTVLAGANRDPKVFVEPDRFDVLRENAREHLAFSAGRHYCLGAALARMEGEVGLRAFFDRFPDARLAPGAARRSTRILRGWERLPVRLGA